MSKRSCDGSSVQSFEGCSDEELSVGSPSAARAALESSPQGGGGGGGAVGSRFSSSGSNAGGGNNGGFAHGSLMWGGSAGSCPGSTASGRYLNASTRIHSEPRLPSAASILGIVRESNRQMTHSGNLIAPRPASLQDVRAVPMPNSLPEPLTINTSEEPSTESPHPQAAVGVKLQLEERNGDQRLIGVVASAPPTPMTTKSESQTPLPSPGSRLSSSGRQSRVRRGSDVMSGLSQSARRRTNVFMEVAENKEQDLGVTFHTRANSVPKRSGSMRRLANEFLSFSHLGRPKSGPTAEVVALSRIFPEAEPLYHERDTDLDCENDFRSWLRQLRERRVPFSSHTSYSTLSNSLLRTSAVFSCAYVLVALALEPACVPAETGSPLHRISDADVWWRLQGLGFLLHAINSAIYTALSAACRLLFGRIDPKKGEEIVSLVEVIHSQMGTIGFWLDVAALTGFFAELMHLSEAPREEGTPSRAQWCTLFQLGKAWRVFLPEVSANPRRSTFVEGVGWLLFSMAYVAHVAACCLLALGVQESSWGKTSWTDSLLKSEQEITCVSLYTEAFYFAALSLTSVGYGDVLTTPLERGVNAAFLLLFQLFCTKVCADLTWLTSTHNHWEAEHQAQRAQTWASLQNMSVPQPLAQRVLAFQSYVAKVHREDLSNPIFSGLSANLIQELRLCTYRKLVLQAVFLREQPKEVIRLIVGSVVDEVFLPADFILRLGSKGRELYFVRKGCASVYVGPEAPVWGTSKEVAHYVAGNYFGELAMLTGKPRAAWVMATTYCVCTVLPYSAVEKLAVEHPGAFTRLVQSMIQAYNLKATMKWEQVVDRMQERYGFGSPEDMFCWLCGQGGDPEEDHLTAKAFDEGMRRLKVPHLDRKIFWAEMDMDSSGEVSFEEFLDNLPDSTSPAAANRSPRHSLRHDVEHSDSIVSPIGTLRSANQHLSDQGPVMRETSTTLENLEELGLGLRRFQTRTFTAGDNFDSILDAARPQVRGFGQLARRPSDSRDPLGQALDDLMEGAQRTMKAAILLKDLLAPTRSSYARSS